MNCPKCKTDLDKFEDTEAWKCIQCKCFWLITEIDYANGTTR